jgi:hypothetical protein
MFSLALLAGAGGSRECLRPPDQSFPWENIHSPPEVPRAVGILIRVSPPLKGRPGWEGGGPATPAHSSGRRSRRTPASRAPGSSRPGARTGPRDRKGTSRRAAAALDPPPEPQYPEASTNTSCHLPSPVVMLLRVSVWHFHHLVIVLCWFSSPRWLFSPLSIGAEDVNHQKPHFKGCYFHTKIQQKNKSPIVAILMKIGPNDITREHFGHFFFFFLQFKCPEVQEKLPQIPKI